MPVTEAEALKALPPQGWLRTYVLHASRQTTAPLIYHFGVGLAILGTTCPPDYGTRYAGPLRANTFCLLVGRSGEDLKSSALGVGTRLLDQADPSLVGEYPGSPEGLLDMLHEQGTRYIPISEFGKFLAAAGRGYFEPMKTLLADLWDSHPTQRAKANRKVVRIEKPRLSIGAACSVPYLEKHTLAEDWTGGFMGRWAVFYGRTERIDPDPVGDDSALFALTQGLVQRSQLANAGWCSGFTPRAAKLWRAWFFDVAQRRLPNNILGIRARAPTMARKFALIYGWDFGPASLGKPWRMDLDVLLPALHITELHIKSLVELSQSIATHPDARLRRSVLRVLEENGGQATLGTILGVLKMRRRPVVEIIDSLLEEQAVLQVRSLQGVTYKLA
jgi:hypothetical protein